MQPAAPRSRTKKWLIPLIVIVFIIVFAIVGRLVGRFVTSQLTKNKSTTSQTTQSPKAAYIEQAVNEAKASTTLPKQLDEVTVWNSIAANPEDITYEYTLVNVTAEQIDSEKLRANIVSTLCSDASTKSVLDHDVKMVYHYTLDSTKTRLFGFVITKSDCA